ncbi:MAG: PKD domain-containing protein [Anaerolineae bacterium]|nr:PKD domain-containing protein [Anaerolineae bacterium]
MNVVLFVFAALMLVLHLQNPGQPEFLVAQNHVEMATSQATLKLSSTETPSPQPSATSTTTPSPTVTATSTQTSTETPEPTDTPTETAELPIVSLYAEPASGQAPLEVTFFNDTLGEAIGFEWDLDGDGVVDSTDFEPSSFLYTEPGEYRVTLTAMDAAGASETATLSVIVYGINVEETATPTPTFTSSPEPRATPDENEALASFVVSPASGDAPLTVSFTNDTLGNAVSYSWDFNGDNISDSTSPLPPPYVYQTSGEYTVTLRVMGANGIQDTATSTVIVYAQEEVSERPSAQFSVEPASGSAPLSVVFTLESDDDITVYLWDFNGDGVTDSRDAHPAAYVYTSPGIHQARLLVSGPGGVSEPFYQTITVVEETTQPTQTPMVVSTMTMTPTATVTATVTSTLVPTGTPTATLLPSNTPTATLSPTATVTFVTITPILTPTETVLATETVIATIVGTPTLILETPLPEDPTPTATFTATPSLTNVFPTSTGTATPTDQSKRAATPTPTFTFTPTASPSVVPSETPTTTMTPSLTPISS